MSVQPNVPSPSPTAPRARFIEPTSTLPLRWGSYSWRLLLGGSAIVIGIASVLFTSTYTLSFLAVGLVLQLAGWIVLPARGWTRLVALGPCLFISCLLLAGADFAVFATVFLAGWLLVRERPLISWITIALPLAAGLSSGAIFRSYEQNWAAFSLMGAAVVVGAWLALLLARAVTRKLPAKSASLEA